MKYIGIKIASKNKKKVSRSALVKTPITADSRTKIEIKKPFDLRKLDDDERSAKGTSKVVSSIITKEIPSYPMNQLIPYGLIQAISSTLLKDPSIFPNISK